MSSPNLGLGVAPLGVSLYGYGQPAQASGIVSNVFVSATGLNINMDAANIDLQSQDYSFDANGNVLGMSSVTQQVYLALMTTLNSTSVVGLGSELKNIKVLNEKIVTNVQNYVNQALSSLVQTGLIILLSVDVVVVSAGAIALKVTFFDNTIQQTTSITI